MSPLQKQIDEARNEYDSIRYECDLGELVLQAGPVRTNRQTIIWWAASVATVAASLLLFYALRPASIKDDRQPIAEAMPAHSATIIFAKDSIRLLPDSEPTSSPRQRGFKLIPKSSRKLTFASLPTRSSKPTLAGSSQPDSQRSNPQRKQAIAKQARTTLPLTRRFSFDPMRSGRLSLRQETEQMNLQPFRSLQFERKST